MHQDFPKLPRPPKHFWENHEQSGLSQHDYLTALNWWIDQGFNRDYDKLGDDWKSRTWVWGEKPLSFGDLEHKKNNYVWPDEEPWRGEPLWYIEDDNMHYTHVPDEIKESIKADLSEEEKSIYSTDASKFFWRREYAIVIAAWVVAHPLSTLKKARTGSSIWRFK